MASFAHDVLLALWYFLPAGVANMAPFFAAKMPWLKAMNTPMDFGRSFGGTRLLGPHKTWRGFVAGVAAGAIIFWLQSLLTSHSTSFAALTVRAWVPTVLPVWTLGVLLGLGAVGGDAIKSFFKRRVNVAPGRGWALYDQIDAIAGAEAVSLLAVRLPWSIYGIALVLWTAIHLMVQNIGFWLGIKERPL